MTWTAEEERAQRSAVLCTRQQPLSAAPMPERLPPAPG